MFSIRLRRALRTLAVTGSLAVALAAATSIASASQTPRQVDCDSFTHREAAQYVFALTPGDPNRLDIDGDGIACNHLPLRGEVPAATDAAPSLDPDLLFETTVVMPDGGDNSVETERFSASGAVEICYEVSSTRAAGDRGYVNFDLKRGDVNPDDFFEWRILGNAALIEGEQACLIRELKTSDQYYFDLFLNDRMIFHVTVRRVH